MIYLLIFFRFQSLNLLPEKDSWITNASLVIQENYETSSSNCFNDRHHGHHKISSEFLPIRRRWFWRSFWNTHRSSRESFLVFCRDARAHLTVYLEAGSWKPFRTSLSLSLSLLYSYYIQTGSCSRLLSSISPHFFSALTIHSHNGSTLLLVDADVGVCADSVTSFPAIGVGHLGISASGTKWPPLFFLDNSLNSAPNNSTDDVRVRRRRPIYLHLNLISGRWILFLFTDFQIHFEQVNQQRTAIRNDFVFQANKIVILIQLAVLSVSLGYRLLALKVSCLQNKKKINRNRFQLSKRIHLYWIFLMDRWRCQTFHPQF